MIDYTGYTNINHQNERYIVLEYIHNSNKFYNLWKVQFEQTKSIRYVTAREIKFNTIKDLYLPSRYGKGYVGENGYRKTCTQEGILWSDMLMRCYNKKCKDYKSYGAKGVYVCDRWLNLGNFILDIPLIDGYDEIKFKNKELKLDKDLKQKNVNRKVYSLETCTFLIEEQNKSLLNHEKNVYEVINPNGIKEYIEGLVTFCKKYHISHSTIKQRLDNHSLKPIKGFVFLRKIEN